MSSTTTLRGIYACVVFTLKFVCKYANTWQILALQRHSVESLRVLKYYSHVHLGTQGIDDLISSSGDGGVLKSIITKGDGYSTPAEGAVVEGNYDDAPLQMTGSYRFYPFSLSSKLSSYSWYLQWKDV